MSEIAPVGPARAAASIRPGARRGPGGFPAPAIDSAAPPPPAAAPGAVSLATMLALQDEGEPVEDREARRHGRDLLAELDALHAALLGRPGAFDGLRRLATLVDHPPAMAQDPRLADAVAEISLRARVELARYATPR